MESVIIRPRMYMPMADYHGRNLRSGVRNTIQETRVLGGNGVVGGEQKSSNQNQDIKNRIIKNKLFSI